MSEQSIRTNVRTAIDSIRYWEDEARKSVSLLFPQGAHVEVKLACNQQNWTKGEVLCGGYRPGTIRVSLDTKGKRPWKNIVRDVPIENARVIRAARSQAKEGGTS